MTRRRESRKSLGMEALLRTARNRQNLTVSDISCNGCRIRGDQFDLSEGQKVVLNPPNFEGLPGTVRWSSDHGLGIEFDKPLHESVVEHLCSLYPDGNNFMSMSVAAA